MIDLLIILIVLGVITFFDGMLVATREPLSGENKNKPTGPPPLKFKKTKKR